MFKNIEISEINKEVVVGSLFITWCVFFLCVFLMGWQTDGLLQAGVILLYAVSFGAILWIPITLIISFAERIVIGKRATEKTVIWLLVLELCIPFIIILSRTNRHYEASLSILTIVVFGQFIRWVYLQHKGRIFNQATKPKREKISPSYTAKL